VLISDFKARFVGAVTAPTSDFPQLTNKYKPIKKNIFK